MPLNKGFLNFEVMLDAKVKHYKSITYGVIDAIGTLGGVFEILLWVLMLFYGSIRENMNLFYIINSLIQIHKDADPRINGCIINDIPIAKNSLNDTKNNRNSIHINSRNKQMEVEVSPILTKRQQSKEDTKMQSDTGEFAKIKYRYPYSVLFKSLLPLSKC